MSSVPRIDSSSTVTMTRIKQLLNINKWAKYYKSSGMYYIKHLYIQWYKNMLEYSDFFWTATHILIGLSTFCFLLHRHYGPQSLWGVSVLFRTALCEHFCVNSAKQQEWEMGSSDLWAELVSAKANSVLKGMPIFLACDCFYISLIIAHWSQLDHDQPSWESWEKRGWLYTLHNITWTWKKYYQ